MATVAFSAPAFLTADDAKTVDAAEQDSSSDSDNDSLGDALLHTGWGRRRRTLLLDEHVRPELDTQAAVVAFATCARQSHGHIFEFMTMRDAVELRGVSRGMRKICAEHPWDDPSDAPGVLLRKYPRRWQGSFPRAKAVSTRRATSDWLPLFSGCRRVFLSSFASTIVGASSNLTALADADLSALREAETIVLAGCNLPPELSSAGFAHISGVRVLDISGNRRVRITDGVLACLRGIRELSMGGTLCSGVTDAGWAALSGISVLRAPLCWGLRVTDAGLACIAGVRVIDLTSTDRSDLTDAGLRQLAGARVVRLGSTPTGTYGGVDRAPLRVTDAGFIALSAVEVGKGAEHEWIHQLHCAHASS